MASSVLLHVIFSPPSTFLRFNRSMAERERKGVRKVFYHSPRQSSKHSRKQLLYKAIKVYVPVSEMNLLNKIKKYPQTKEKAKKKT